MKTRLIPCTIVLGIWATANGGHVAMADDQTSLGQLQEVVVTAEKREVSVKEIPIAIYATTGKHLADSGISSVQDLPQLATGLQFGTQSNTTFASIRGVGSEIPDLGGEAAVAITQDGLTLAHPQLFNADFLDVGRIEVLRGPQGTIQGRNASAGAINIYSNLPTAEPTGSIELGYGSYNDFKTEAILSGPILGSGLLGRIAAATETGNGWWRNTVVENPTVTREQDTNNKSRTHVRGSILAKSSQDFTALLTVEYLIDHSIPQQGVYLNARTAPNNPNLIEAYNATFNANIPYPDVQGLRGATDFWQSQYVTQSNTGLKLSWSLSPTSSLTSLTGYIDHRSEAYYDYDDTAAQISENDPIDYTFKTFSEEITLLAKPLSSFDLVAGILYLRDYGTESPLTYTSALEGLTSPGYSIVGPFQWTTSTGAYGQIRYFASDALHFDFGARYTRDKKDYEFTSATINSTFVPFDLRDSHSWSAFTPRVAVGYDIGRSLTWYASVARGYKSGGYNTFAVPLSTYNPEYVTTYETGLKYQDSNFRGAADVFYSNYKDIQQFLYKTLVGTSFESQIVNAAAARIYGLEADLNARVTDMARVFGNVSLTHARFTDLNTANPYTGGGIENLSGNVLPRAPTVQAVAGAEFEVPVAGNLNFVFNSNFRWQSKQYNDLFDTPAGLMPAYGILNARAEIETLKGDWQVAAYINNALDKRYFTNILISAPASVQGNVGTPRLYGVTVTHDF
ncbi:MAG TPA: TonB-dependent receptor [Steroidobacteraceae bacterium]|nr:TonB-dependent receptor [Steroidobacteraceae bacterium]